MEETFVISANAKLRYDDNLRVGAGNFWREEYVDEQGVSHEGVRAGLWLAVLDDSSPNQHVRVHVGQVVEYDSYQIKVVEIDQEDGTPFVRLAISSSNPETEES